MSYGKPRNEEWEEAVLAEARTAGRTLGTELGRLFLAGEARIAAGDGCPDCGNGVGHTMPCAQYDAAQALLRLGVGVPGYMKG